MASHLWRDLKVGVALGDMVCSGLGRAGLTVGLDDLRGVFQPK